MNLSETPAEFSKRLQRLEALARVATGNDAEFLRHMSKAKAAGLTYREGLENLLRECIGGAD